MSMAVAEGEPEIMVSARDVQSNLRGKKKKGGGEIDPS